MCNECIRNTFLLKNRSRLKLRLPSKSVADRVHDLAGDMQCQFNPLNAELNPIRHLLALVGARHIVHVSRIGLRECKYCTAYSSVTGYNACKYAPRAETSVTGSVKGTIRADGFIFRTGYSFF